MSAQDWQDVDLDVAESVSHFQKAAAISRREDFDQANMDGYVAQMAFMHAMQSAYTSLENGMKRVLLILGETPPVGDQSHADLVRRCVTDIGARPAIFSRDVASDVEKTRRFRHVAVHGYGRFDPKDAGDSAAAASRLATRLPGEIASFKARIDPPATPAPNPHRP